MTTTLQNQEGTGFTTNYLRRPVLASYRPLPLEGLPWATVVEMDAAEVFAPIYRLDAQ